MSVRNILTVETRLCEVLVPNTTSFSFLTIFYRQDIPNGTYAPEKLFDNYILGGMKEFRTVLFHTENRFQHGKHQQRNVTDCAYCFEGVEPVRYRNE